jgi:hypothetical protein
MSNFDLKKYLIENKLTAGSRLNESLDLSKKNNYLDDNNEVDSREVASDLFRIKSYFKSKLPLYFGKPLTDFQIDSLIDMYAANERDISASMPTGPGETERIQGKWKNVDIDDLADDFVGLITSWAEDDWEDIEFYDVSQTAYSDWDWGKKGDPDLKYRNPSFNDSDEDDEY